MKKIILTAAAILSLVGAIPGQPVAAADTSDEIFNQLQAAGGEQGAGLELTDPRSKVMGIIRVAFGLLGTIFLVLIIYAGFLWMTAGGNEEQVGKAKKWILNSVIGLVIVLAAYSITVFAINFSLGVTREGGVSVEGCSGLDCMPNR